MAERRHRVGSVRFRSTVAATVAVGAVLLVASVGLVAAQSRQLRVNLDRSLQQRADDLEAELRSSGPPRQPAARRGGDPGVAQIIDGRGQVVSASAGMVGQPAIARPPPGHQREAFRSVDRLPVDDDHFRILSRRVTARGAGWVIHVAASADPIEEDRVALRNSLLLGVPVVLAAVAAITWFLVGRTLRPIESIRAEVASIAGRDRGRRVPRPEGDDEVARLAATMNEMLERTDVAAEHQQRFVADASHELRSPLTRMRTELEVDLAHPELAQPIETHRRVLAGIDRMERLADDLLALARGEGGLLRRREVLDLDDVVLDEVARIRPSTTVTLDASQVSAAQVAGDRVALARVISNLVDNAVRHAVRSVRVTLQERGDVVHLTVADDGPGIGAADRERIFDRFVRLDDGRSPNGGNGLGLAIVRELVVAHGGIVSVGERAERGAVLVVTLPAARDAAVAEAVRVDRAPGRSRRSRRPRRR
ncbi:MAG: putative two-component sensor kinase [Acidimicrobiales bacterium]|nr:putative two-component sensor kinase [Acidimicrobiales bacterium]